MKKEIRNVDEKKGIVQVTTVDERWYIRATTDVAGLPAYEFVPSVTWIADNYPKGIGFYKWLAAKGWDEAEAIKTAAADKGSKVHQAIGVLIDRGSIKINSTFTNNTTGQDEELTLEEYEAILSFVLWVKEIKPKFLQRDFVVWGDGYAGTVDALCFIEGKICLIDFKTSPSIWPSHELQVSAYLHALPKQEGSVSLAILQLGYRLNKKLYKFTEIEDQYSLFLAAKQIWAKENGNKHPAQKDYPLEVSLA